MKEKLIVDVGVSLFQPELFLPAQFFAALKQRAQAQGERRLMVAVLEDAIECVQKHFWDTDSRRRRLHTEAEQWIFSDDDSWLFSFVNICDVLDIHPLFLRRGLTRWKAQQLAPRETPLNGLRTQSGSRKLEPKRDASATYALRAAGERNT